MGCWVACVYIHHTHQPPHPSFSYAEVRSLFLEMLVYGILHPHYSLPQELHVLLVDELHDFMSLGIHFHGMVIITPFAYAQELQLLVKAQLAGW
ncbi:MAG: hypothetical protein J6Y37_08055, partial [Paludibacteraceae bacterium]|nr:hypothetical protein [Paludibacteraceae bacterium]